MVECVAVPVRPAGERLGQDIFGGDILAQTAAQLRHMAVADAAAAAAGAEAVVVVDHDEVRAGLCKAADVAADSAGKGRVERAEGVFRADLAFQPDEPGEAALRLCGIRHRVCAAVTDG